MSSMLSLSRNLSRMGARRQRQQSLLLQHSFSSLSSLSLQQQQQSQRTRPFQSSFLYSPQRYSFAPQQLTATLSTVTEPSLRADDDQHDNPKFVNLETSASASVDSIADATTEHLEGETPTPDSTTTSVEYDLNDLDVQARLSRVKSQPKPGGNWNLKDPLAWSRHFGRRSPAKQERLDKLIRLQPGDEGYFDVSDMTIPGITIVRTKEQAKIVLERLYKYGAPTSEEKPYIFHACDTEVMDLSLKQAGPVGNGYVTCFSMYSGPDFDYGLGDGPGSCLWIDNLDDACGILQEFKDWLEDERFLKVWHNVGFDRHVMWNEGIDVKGFGGDTMHMARLQDTSRLRSGSGYSLESLTHDLLNQRKIPMKEIFGVPRKRKDGSDGSILDIPAVEVMQRDPKHREKWIKYSAFDAKGTWYLRKRLQELLEKRPWIGSENMDDYYMMHMRPFAYVLTDMERRGIRVDAKSYLASVERTARSDRAKHEATFRSWVASLYPEHLKAHGLALNPASSTQLQTFLFGGASNAKTKEVTPTVRVFKVPSSEIPEEAWEVYEAQLKKDQEKEATEKAKRYRNDTSNQQALDDVEERLGKMKVAELKADCKEFGLKVSGAKKVLIDRLKTHFMEVGKADPVSVALGDLDVDSLKEEDLRSQLKSRGLSTEGSKEEMIDRLRSDIETTLSLSEEFESEEKEAITLALKEASRKQENLLASYLQERAGPDDEKERPKYFELQVLSLQELIDQGRLESNARALDPIKFTAGGAPSVTSDVLKKLAGDPDNDKYGLAQKLLGDEGCKALASLCAIGSIDTMIANFLTTLQVLVDEDSRVHGSLNLNTETGRLSSRQPNLQNQPALEKDKYKIRKAFQSSPGNNLIVADYGQLELRILASLTHCKSMIEAFESGGDFHSRTALDMFDYIKEKVDAGEVLLEWDYSKGDPPKPLLKDEYGAERRKAKTLNFSIAYGKTAHGLSQDWGVSKAEAEEMLQKWYAARPEVEQWQQMTKVTARNHGVTRTLMGRYRHLPDAMKNDRKLLGHAERASINTPIQGGAADIAMMAMIKINDSQKLKDLGWILLLQIHDEVILEGPEETAEEAFEEVLQCMQEPWTYGLSKTSVPLLVDGSCVHKTWYDAK